MDPSICWTLYGAAIIAVFAVNALVGAELSGQQALAGVPEAVRVLGQAFAALAWGYTMERIGRRRGLAMGQMVGVVGSGITVGPSSLAPFLFSRRGW